MAAAILTFPEKAKRRKEQKSRFCRAIETLMRLPLPPEGVDAVADLHMYFRPGEIDIADLEYTQDLIEAAWARIEEGGDAA